MQLSCRSKAKPNSHNRFPLNWLDLLRASLADANRMESPAEAFLNPGPFVNGEEYQRIGGLNVISMKMRHPFPRATPIPAKKDHSL